MVHRTLRRVTGSAMAVAGGALVTFGGVANHSFLLSILGLVDENLGGFLSGVPLYLVEASILAITVLIGLGVLTVIGGGVLIFVHHTTTGRLLIALGGGAGFLGLLLSFGYTAFSSGLADALGHSVYWIGLAVSVGARRIAKGA